MTGEWISDPNWRTIVANVPIVSVDLLVRHNGKLVLGKRRYEPAKGYWFVPGGRVHKGETRIQAVHRIADEELGLSVEVIESIGAYEHLYTTAEVKGVDGKHYLANGYVVDSVDGGLISDDQHDEIRLFQNPPEPLHKYIRKYLQDADSLTDWL